MAGITERRRLRAERARARGWDRHPEREEIHGVPYVPPVDGTVVALSPPVSSETYAVRMAACASCAASATHDGWTYCRWRDCKAWPVDALNRHAAQTCLDPSPRF